MIRLEQRHTLGDRNRMNNGTGVWRRNESIARIKHRM